MRPPGMPPPIIFPRQVRSGFIPIALVAAEVEPEARNDFVENQHDAVLGRQTPLIFSRNPPAENNAHVAHNRFKR